jgi:arginyl-tRNA synthetase
LGFRPPRLYSRVKAAIDAMGYDSKKLTVLLVQFVSLWRGGEMVQMSSRSGQFVTLRDYVKKSAMMQLVSTT